MDKEEIVREGEEFSVNCRRFSKKENRLMKANHIVLLSLTVIKAFLLLAFVAQILSGEVNYLVIGVPCVVLFIGLVLDWVMYLKNICGFPQS